MPWVYFTILAAMSWAISNLIHKYILSRYTPTPMISTIFMGCLGLVVAIIIFQFTEVFIPPLELLILSLTSGLMYVIAIMFYFKAIMIEEVSRVVPLFSINPIFILILATIFLGEIFSFQKYLGIFILAIGSFLISLRKGAKFIISKAFGLMIIATLFLAVNNILAKYILNSLTYWNTFVWIRIGTFLPIPLLFYINRKQTIETVSKKPKCGLYLAISQLFNIIALIFSTIALSYGFVSLVGALGQIQNFIVLVFATLLSIFKPNIIKEELKRSTILQKIIATMLILSGATLIT